MVDLEALRAACAPIAAWWADYRNTGHPDPDRLEAATRAARQLPPIPGRLGAALAYVLDPTDLLTDPDQADLPAIYHRAHEAFELVARAGTTPLTTLDDLSPLEPDRATQLRFDEILDPAIRRLRP